MTLTGILRNLELHETTWKYPSGHTSDLPSRLHHSEEAVNEEEKNWAHGFTSVIPVDMKDIEYEEDEIEVVQGEERFEISRTNVRKGRESHDDCCNACYCTGQIRASSVRPFDQLSADQQQSISGTRSTFNAHGKLLLTNHTHIFRHADCKKEDEENREVPEPPVIFNSLFEGNIYQSENWRPPCDWNEEDGNCKGQCSSKHSRSHEPL